MSGEIEGPGHPPGKRESSKSAKGGGPPRQGGASEIKTLRAGQPPAGTPKELAFEPEQREHQEAPAPEASASGAGARKGGNTGTIYKVPGEATESGKPYIGRHNQPDPATTRKSNDGRDRTKAEVVDTYNASDKQEGRTKEQQQIDQHGLQNLDNKRNEIRKDKKPDSN